MLIRTTNTSKWKDNASADRQAETSDWRKTDEREGETETRSDSARKNEQKNERINRILGKH